MPWWISTLLAASTYFVLHHFATRPPVVPGSSPTGDALARPLLTTLAGMGQYLLPGALLVGAGISIWRRLQDRNRLAAATGNDAAQAMRNMDWREFESLVGQAFEGQGYEATRTGGAGPDDGVDLILVKGGETFLVQCKQWRAFKVGVQVVRELYGVMAAQGAAGGFVVTSGRFTDDSMAFAEGRNILLIDGPKLQSMLHGLSPRQSPPRSTPASTPITTGSAQSSPERSASACPDCPRCGKPMIERTARRGTHAGATFWGCPDYPTCRGTRDRAG